MPDQQQHRPILYRQTAVSNHCRENLNSAGRGRRSCVPLARRPGLLDSKNVKKYVAILTTIVGVMLASLGAARADTGWETDVKKAQAQAKSSNKLVFLDFTGSDWCG